MLDEKSRLQFEVKQFEAIRGRDRGRWKNNRTGHNLYIVKEIGDDDPNIIRLILNQFSKEIKIWGSGWQAGRQAFTHAHSPSAHDRGQWRSRASRIANNVGSTEQAG